MDVSRKQASKNQITHLAKEQMQQSDEYDMKQLYKTKKMRTTRSSYGW